MSGLVGDGVGSKNFVLRFCLIAFLGSVGLGLVLSWRATSLLTAEYQEIPQSTRMVKIKQQNLYKQQSLSQNN